MLNLESMVDDQKFFNEIFVTNPVFILLNEDVHFHHALSNDERLTFLLNFKLC